MEEPNKDTNDPETLVEKHASFRKVMSDKLKIKISIANRVYPLIIDPKKEESLRIAAQEINSLVKKIEENYSVQDKQDALAMCALQISAKKKQSIHYH